MIIFCHYIWGLGIGDWGLGIGDWGLGIGDWAQSPIPNPHPQSPRIYYVVSITSYQNEGPIQI